MKSNNVSRRRLAFFACLGLAAVVNASVSHAGTVYLYLVTDPAATAGAGVPASGGFNVTSNRSGAGSWHLYALDDADGSAGLRSFFVKLNPGLGGTIPTINNRSPIAQWDDDPSFGSGNGPFNVGFSDIRTTTPFIGAAQGPTNTVQIGGFGISASNFQTKTGGASYNGTTSGQWGVYADPSTTGSLQLSNGHTRNWLFLAEGTYTGAAPTIDITTPFASGGSGVTAWTAAGFPNQGSFIVAAGFPQQLTIYITPEPATITLVGLAVIGFGGLVRRRRS